MPATSNHSACLLAILMPLCAGAASAAEPESPRLQIENRTSGAIESIRLTSGEKYLTESWKKETPCLKAGLRTYPEKVSAVSIGSSVNARLHGKEVIFRCHTPIEQRPKSEQITCVLTEENGAFKAEYVPTPFANYFKAPRSERLGINQIAVVGTVMRPGLFEIDAEDLLTLEEALGLAGGIHAGDWLNSPAAAPRKVRLTRVVDGQEQNFTLDAVNTAEEKGKDLKFPILPGDEIYVGYYF